MSKNKNAGDTSRPTWVGYFTRKTKTKKDKIKQELKKEKQKNSWR